MVFFFKKHFHGGNERQTHLESVLINGLTSAIGGKVSKDAMVDHRHRASFFRCDLKAPADSIVGVPLFSQPMDTEEGRGLYPF